MGGGGTTGSQQIAGIVGLELNTTFHVTEEWQNLTLSLLVHDSGMLPCGYTDTLKQTQA